MVLGLDLTHFHSHLTAVQTTQQPAPQTVQQQLHTSRLLRPAASRHGAALQHKQLRRVRQAEQGGKHPHIHNLLLRLLLQPEGTQRLSAVLRLLLSQLHAVLFTASHPARAMWSS
jgi:hypothetical protein